LPEFVLKATCQLPVGYPTEIAGVCIQADRKNNRIAVQRMCDRGEAERNAEHRVLD